MLPEWRAVENRFLLVRARSWTVALALGDVVETMRPLPAEPLAGMPPFVLGVALIRGAPRPVIDLGALVAPGRSGTASRFVTVRTGPRVVALAVEAILGVRELEARGLGELPPLLRDGPADVRAIGAVDGELALVLGAARVVPEEVFPT